MGATEKNKRFGAYCPVELDTRQGRVGLPAGVLWGVCCLFVFLTYAGLKRVHFDGDLYWHITQRALHPQVTLGGGRPIQALVYWLLNAAGYDYVSSQSLGTLSLIGSLGISASLLAGRFLRVMDRPDVYKCIGTLSASLLVFCNVFVWEWFAHPTSAPALALAFLSMTGAVLLITGKASLWRSAGAFFLLALADNTYQVFFEFFVILSLPLLFMDQGCKCTRRLLGRSLAVLGVGALSALSNLALTKLLQGFVGADAWALIGDAANRAGTLDAAVLWSNLRLIASSQRTVLVEAFGLLPSYALAGATLALTGLLILTLLRQKRMFSGSAGYLAAMGAGCCLLLYAPHLISAAPAILARTQMALFALLSGMSCLILAMTKRPALIKTTAALMILLLGYNVYAIQQYSLNVLEFNALDKKEALSVNDVITAYEKESGAEVRFIAICTDDSPAVYGDYMPDADNPVFQRALTMPWADTDALNYYTGRELRETKLPEAVYSAHFSGKNWDCFIPGEQMVFDGDTLYLAVY